MTRGPASGATTTDPRSHAQIRAHVYPSGGSIRSSHPMAERAAKGFLLILGAVFFTGPLIVLMIMMLLE